MDGQQLGQKVPMIVALLSRRLRSWLLLTVLLPVIGRVLQALGVRVSPGHPRIGRTLESVGGVARSPRSSVRGRRRQITTTPRTGPSSA